MNQETDTIAAIATARGRSALAIVRVSGPASVSIVDSCFPAKDLSAAPAFTVHVGYFSSPDGTSLDQVVVTLFRGPNSSTGEDVVEVTCHGGDFAPQLILRALLDAGARLADPGEFTQRAFLNGKLDLTQAEAVADLIHASSSAAHRVSLNHLQGEYSQRIQAVRSELVELAAMIELELDFSEEDVEFADRDRLSRLLETAARLLTGLVDSYRMGALLRDGIRVVIGGRPNAGKSTLLNALIGKDRAIVSPIPGTTRDEVEADVEIGGLLFRFVDTAGLRATEDFVEAEGVRRARKSIFAADVLVYVYDLVAGLDEEEQAFLQKLQSDQPVLPVIVVGNKRDRVPTVEEFDSGYPFMAVVASDGESDESGIKPLREWLVDTVRSGLSDTDGSTVVINQRHRQHLSLALDAVNRAIAHMKGIQAGGETLAFDLRLALHELGAITGEITNEDILGEIFSRFCIGK